MGYFPVYYRIYYTNEHGLTIVCLQAFDEDDYNQHNFLTDEQTGAKLRFDSEEEAIVYLNNNFKSEYIDERYKAPTSDIWADMRRVP